MPTRSAEVRRELGSVARRALPIIATRLAQMGMGIGDTVMAVDVSAVDLAGVALGGNLFWAGLTLGFGLVATFVLARFIGLARRSEHIEVLAQR